MSRPLSKLKKQLKQEVCVDCSHKEQCKFKSLCWLEMIISKVINEEQEND